MASDLPQEADPLETLVSGPFRDPGDPVPRTQEWRSQPVRMAHHGTGVRTECLQGTVRRAVAPAVAPAVDFAELRDAISVGRVRELRGWFTETNDEAHQALRVLLSDRRFSVYRDDAYQWRIEGFYEVPGIPLAAARSTLEGERATGRVSGVARARSDRLHRAWIPFVVRMQFSSEAANTRSFVRP